MALWGADTGNGRGRASSTTDRMDAGGAEDEHDKVAQHEAQKANRTPPARRSFGRRASAPPAQKTEDVFVEGAPAAPAPAAAPRRNSFMAGLRRRFSRSGGGSSQAAGDLYAEKTDFATTDDITALVAATAYDADGEPLPPPPPLEEN